MEYTIEEFNKGINSFLKDKSGVNNDIGRYKSWNIIYDLTKEYIDENKDDIDFYTLNMCMYLASWGMYRGSTKLLQRFNYKALIPVCEIILKDEYKILHGLTDINQYTDEIIDLICNLYVEIKDELERIFSSVLNLEKTKRGNKVTVKTSGVTVTLITKFMLGSYGCILAYDTYIRKGLVKLDVKKNINSRESLEESLKGIVDCLKFLGVKKDEYYPIMKRLDMALFSEK